MVDPHANQAETPSTRRILRERSEIAAQIATLVSQARREIALFAPELDPALFNTAALDHALIGFATNHRHNHARLLVEDAQQAVRDNTRLVELARRLSDFVDLRQVGEEHIGRRELFVLVDREGYLHQRDLTHPECLLDLHGHREAVELTQRFQEMWDRSQPIAAIRTTGLR
jgi:hypothetical protein